MSNRLVEPAFTRARRALITRELTCAVGSRVRSEYSFRFVEARLLQWGLVRSPDESIFAVPASLIVPVDLSQPVSVCNARVAVDTTTINTAAVTAAVITAAAAAAVAAAATAAHGFSPPLVSCNPPEEGCLPVALGAGIPNLGEARLGGAP